MDFDRLRFVSERADASETLMSVEIPEKAGSFRRFISHIEPQRGQSAPPRLGSAPARLLRLVRARLAALGSSALPGRGRATGRPATASGSRASRLQSRLFHGL